MGNDFRVAVVAVSTAAKAADVVHVVGVAETAGSVAIEETQPPENNETLTAKPSKNNRT